MAVYLSSGALCLPAATLHKYAQVIILIITTITTTALTIMIHNNSYYYYDNYNSSVI